MIDLCSRGLEKYFSDVLNKHQNIEQLKDNEIMIKEKNKKFKKDLIESSSLFHVFRHFIFMNEKVTDQIIKLMKECISPTIRINCPNELQCPLCITVPNLKVVQQLKTVIFNSVAIASKSNQNFSDFLMINHNILHHVYHSIILFAISYLHNKNKNENQQQQSYISPSFLNSSIFLLHNLLSDRPTNCKYIADIPSILSSLIKLINFNLKTLIDKDDDELANEIRKNSRKCLNQVQQYGDESIQAQLSSLGYACSLSLTISTACGSVEEYDDEIWSQLFTIRQFLSGLQKGRLTSYLDNQLQLQAKTTPVNQPIEQIEEEGGLEEIEDHQFNGSIDNIKFGANEAKYVLQYIQIGLSNPNPWWYWLF